MLSDPEKRQVYDAYGEEGLKAGGGPGGPGGAGAQQFNFRSADDIFREVSWSSAAAVRQFNSILEKEVLVHRDDQALVF